MDVQFRTTNFNSPKLKGNTMSNTYKHSVKYTRNDRIFADLEDYLLFCKDFGYRYDENDLYNAKSYSWRQYQKICSGKPAKNMWDQDLLIMKSESASY